MCNIVCLESDEVDSKCSLYICLVVKPVSLSLRPLCFFLMSTQVSSSVHHTSKIKLLFIGWVVCPEVCYSHHKNTYTLSMMFYCPWLQITQGNTNSNFKLLLFNLPNAKCRLNCHTVFLYKHKARHWLQIVHDRAIHTKPLLRNKEWHSTGQNKQTVKETWP